MYERTVIANGVRIWCAEHGDPQYPAVILIPGATATADAFLPEYYEPIVHAGFRVIRIDNRDIGRSEWINYAANPYTIEDMAADIVGVMDALGIQRAHLIGTSMGGMIAQTVALRWPQRVLTLTSQLSSPGASDPSLPGMSEEIMQLAKVRLSEDPEERVEQRLRLFRALCGSRFPFDEELRRDQFRREIEANSNPNSAHGRVVQESPSRLHALRDLKVPTLIIHGTEDPVIPYPHAVAMAKAIPGATLHPMEGCGHETPLPLYTEITAAVIRHLRSVSG